LPYRYGEHYKISLVRCENLCLPHPFPNPKIYPHTHHWSPHLRQVRQTLLAYLTSSLSLGAQSGSQSVLDRISRGHTVEDVKCAVEICREYDLTPVVDVIFGLPGETVADQQETLDRVGFVVNKGGRIHSHYFTPLPGTPLEDAVPSPVGKDVNRAMGQLALGGKVTGVWEAGVRR